MRINNEEAIQKAKEYAFLLLKFRLRSENELRDRLRRKQFDSNVISQVVDFLKEKEFIDDEKFSKAWIKSRINRKLGLRRICSELKLKGISKKIIDSQVKKVASDYSESEVVKSIVEERLSKLKGIDPQVVKRRIYGYLLRRGFSPEIIYEALS
ncbi:MAG: regulatory protein RecX [Candidatus Omnitrophica bacterium]|nr:regulatory protein RecX [Candidatus Omnitrophota bacterium]